MVSGFQLYPGHFGYHVMRTQDPIPFFYGRQSCWGVVPGLGGCVCSASDWALLTTTLVKVEHWIILSWCRLMGCKFSSPLVLTDNLPGKSWAPVYTTWFSLSGGCKISFLMGHASQQERSGGLTHTTLMLQDGAEAPHFLPLPLSWSQVVGGGSSVLSGHHWHPENGWSGLSAASSCLASLFSITDGWVWRFSSPLVPADTRDGGKVDC